MPESGDFGDWRTDTAQRPVDPAVQDAGTTSGGEEPAVIPRAAQPLPPPPAFETPPAPRYPLYADELADGPADGPADGSVGAGGTSGPSAADEAVPAWLAEPETAGRRRSRWVPGAVALLAVVAMAAGGVVLLGHRGGDAAADLPPAATGPSPSTPSSSSGKPSPSGTPSRTPSPRPSHQPKPDPVPVDVTRFARVTAPPSAPPGVDTRGNAVRYSAFNLLDGVPSTAWRMLGDGQGRTITLRLRRTTVLTQVGLVNGYAKRDGTYDGYRTNRHVKKVRWLFDGGRSVTQKLRGTRTLQTVAVPSVRTRTVRLVLERVGRRRPSPDHRDYTAISDLSVLGTPR